MVSRSSVALRGLVEPPGSTPSTTGQQTQLAVLLFAEFRGCHGYSTGLGATEAEDWQEMGSAAVAFFLVSLRPKPVVTCSIEFRVR